MRYLISYTIKCISRERYKSLIIPILSFALVYLICVMGGIRARMADEFDYMLDEYPIRIVVSDPNGVKTDGLMIGALYVEQFTDPDSIWPLVDYVENLQLKRALSILNNEKTTLDITLVGVNSDMAIEYYDVFGSTLSEDNYASNGLIPKPSVQIEYLDGFDEDTISQYSYYCIVSKDVLEWAEIPTVSAFVFVHRGELIVEQYRITLDIIGTVDGLSECGLVFINSGIANSFFRDAGILGSFEGFQVEDETLIYSFDNGRRDILLRSYQHQIGTLIGISSVDADEALASGQDVQIVYFEGYDESIFSSDDYVCVVDENVLHMVENGILTMSVESYTSYSGPVRAELKVVGTVSIGGDTDEAVVYTPFSIASILGSESGRVPSHTEILRATLADNRDLDDFKSVAIGSFREVSGYYFNPNTFSLTIYDDEFYDITESLQQTIFFIDISTPFVYAIVICIGFIASFLLTRRRKNEYANMRSVGVSRVSIFTCVLFEQTMLCAVGAALGCVLFTLTWGIVLIRWALFFLGCYILGTAFSSIKAAGTDVLRLLREKE